MKKFLVLYLSKLPFAAHSAFFGKRFIPALTSAPAPVQEVIGPLMPALNAAFAKEKTLGEWQRRSEYTGKIAEADHQVDTALDIIGAVVHVALHSDDADTVDAASRIDLMLKNYGNVARKPYETEVGDVANILGRFGGDLAPDVAKIGATLQVAKLGEAFDKFNALFDARNAQNVGKPSYTFGEVEKEMSGAYHQITSLVEINASLGASPAFAALIDELNPEIKYLNDQYYHKSHKDLSAAGVCAVASIPDQPYTGKPIIVIPEVSYSEQGKPSKELVFATDFTVTYRSNTNVGTAEIIIHGKGAYKGQKVVTFSIAKA
jgi:hypothetical protein